MLLSTSPSGISGSQGVEFAVAPIGEQAEFGNPIDAEETRDGHFVVLDSDEPDLLILDSTGAFLSHGGRAGEGPGELRSAIGLALVGEETVVLGGRRDRGLSIVGPDGIGRRHFAMPVPGDWSRATQRPPGVGPDIPKYPASEDVSLRMTTLDDSTVAILVAEDETTAPVDPDDPRAMPPRGVAVLRVAVNEGGLIDTLWHGSTPRAVRIDPAPDARPDWPFPIYAPWPLLATGDGWYAIADGGSPEILVKGSGTVSQITWPASHVEVDDQVKRARLDWYVRRMQRTSDHWKEWWDSLGGPDRERALREERDRYPWAAEAPQVMAMVGHGACLWIAGFSAEEGPIGVARSWVGVNVRDGRVVGVIRVPDPWWRVRSAGRSGILVSYRDEEGEGRVALLRWPEGFRECA